MAKPALIILGAPDNAAPDAFKTIADAVSTGAGRSVPYVAWTKGQLQQLWSDPRWASGPARLDRGPADPLDVLLAPLGVTAAESDVVLYVLAGPADMAKSPAEALLEPGKNAMDWVLMGTPALARIPGIVYVRAAQSPTLPGDPNTVFVARAVGTANNQSAFGSSSLTMYRQAAMNAPGAFRLWVVDATTAVQQPTEITTPPVVSPAVRKYVDVDRLWTPDATFTWVAMPAADIVSGKLGPVVSAAEAAGAVFREGATVPGGGGTKPLVASKASSSFLTHPYVLAAGAALAAYWVFFRKPGRAGLVRRSSSRARSSRSR